jgi:hypothetical protein
MISYSTAILSASEWLRLRGVRAQRASGLFIGGRRHFIVPSVAILSDRAANVSARDRCLAGRDAITPD